MELRMLNRICAYPVMITCVLGACAFDAAVYCSLGVPFRDIAPDWQAKLYFVAVVIPAASLLGFILGMVALWPMIRVICSRINGAPLLPGDQVIVLSGPYKGIVAEVCEITFGQGGWELAQVNLGSEYKERFCNIFEAYSLLRIKRNEQDRAVNANRLSMGGIRPSLLNQICAHSETVVWILGTCACYVAIIRWPLGEVPLWIIATGWPRLLYFLVALIPAILLGSFVGEITCGPLIKAVCSRINGAPIKPGDQVMILSGFYKGTIAEVSKIIIHEGWAVALLDLGIEPEQTLLISSLLKIKRADHFR